MHYMETMQMANETKKVDLGDDLRVKVTRTATVSSEPTLELSLASGSFLSIKISAIGTEKKGTTRDGKSYASVGKGTFQVRIGKSKGYPMSLYGNDLLDLVSVWKDEERTKVLAFMRQHKGTWSAVRPVSSAVDTDENDLRG